MKLKINEFKNINKFYKCILGLAIEKIIFLSTIAVVFETLSLYLLGIIVSNASLASIKNIDSEIKINTIVSSIDLYDAILLMFSAFVLKALFGYLNLLKIASSKRMLSNKLRAQISSMAFINKKNDRVKIEELTNLMGMQVNSILLCFNYYAETITKSVLFFGYMVVAFYLAGYFAAFLVAGSIVTYFLLKKIGDKIKEYSRKTVIFQGELNQKFSEIINNKVYLFVVSKAVDAISILKKSIKNISDVEFNLTRLQAITLIIREPISLILLIISVGIYVYAGGSDYSKLVVVAMLMYRGMNTFYAVISNWQAVVQYSGSINFYQNINKSMDEKEINFNNSNKNNTNMKLVIKDVTFKFNKNKILDSIDLAANPGQITAIIGQSGAGKSTLIKLICGYFEADDGQIYFQNEQSKKFKPGEVKISYLSQKPFIVTGTLLENLDLYSVECKYDKDVIIKFIEQVGLGNWYGGLANGLNSVISNDGSLSGGIEQRIAFVREMLKTPSILILDEFTSALDIETQELVLNTIKEYKNSMNVIFITHRRETLSYADQIYKLENNKIIKQL